MSSPSKNSNCPCGSGKKYKRCCGMEDSSTNKKRQRKTFTEDEFIKKYNSAELLKILSVIQLHPQNHGKNIRIENLITKIVNNVNEAQTKIDYNQLLIELKAICVWHHNEDPPEEFFTENIIFSNGNNIVFPGISTHGKEINQGLISGINAGVNQESLNKDFGKAASESILFILHIHDVIAKELGLVHRQYEEIKSRELFIPKTEFILQKKELFSFSINRIESISKTWRIPEDIIHSFIYDYESHKIESFDLDDNPLFVKPFIKIGNEILLILPTAQLTAINERLIDLANKHNSLENLVHIYNEQVGEELIPTFLRMGWKPVKFGFSDINSAVKRFSLNEFLFRLDTDKLAYVSLFGEISDTIQTDLQDIQIDSNEISKRGVEIISKIKTEFPQHKVLFVGIMNKYRILNRIGLAFNEIEQADEIIFLGKNELEILIHNWDFDSLTLWKYVKYRRLAENKISFMPQNTHLAVFQWYKRNEESFFDSDKESPSHIYFDLEMEGDILRNGVGKMDRIGIPYLNDGKYGYFHCVRKEEHLPIYISEEFYYGILKNCLLKYKCPIWIECKKQKDYLADVYMNAILFWLNEIYQDLENYINQLGELPLTFQIELDDQLYNLAEINSIEDKEALIIYKISTRNRRISFKVPVQIVESLSNVDNEGEKFLMCFILDSIGELLSNLKLGEKLPINERERIMSKNFDFPNKKMIIHSHSEQDLRLSEIDFRKVRYVPDADISYILDNQLSWLSPNKTIPVDVKGEQEKVHLLNSLVSVLLGKLKEEIHKFSFIELIIEIMYRSESSIRERAHRAITFPPKLSCYGKYYDVYEEFSKTENDLNETNLATRILIEFIACEKPKGKEPISSDSIDIMLAYVVELTNYGSISDAINFGIENPKIGLLKSGRLGIQKNVNNNYLKKFKQAMHGEELDSYSEKFKRFFRNNEKKESDDSKDDFIKKVELGFTQEWGISLFKLYDIFYFLATFCFKKGKSVLIIDLSELSKELERELSLGNAQIDFFFEKYILVDRNGIMDIPQGYSRQDIYPWRYNRPISYITQPIIKVVASNQEKLILSARHLLSSAENIISKFFDGTLRVDKKYKIILKLVAEANKRKGNDFRNEIADWISSETTLEVWPYEVKIHAKGFFIAENDKGDIDVLVIDKRKKILYSIECKNTSQSKVAYEYKSEMDNYLGTESSEGLIQKHVKRDLWLKENKIQVMKKLNLNNSYKIKSLVITNNILPIKYLKKSSIEIISFYELKSKKYNF